MKKPVRIVLIAVPVLVIVAVVVLFLSLGATVKAAVETVLPKITGTPVKLEGFDLSVFSGKGTIKTLVIGNPQGFKSDKAFGLKTVRVGVNIRSLLSDRIIIEEIYIDGPEVTYEAAFSGSNIGKIKENVDKFGSAEKQPTAEKKTKPGKKIQVNSFVFKNGKIGLTATMLGGKGVTVPLPDIQLKDIGTGPEGATVGDVANKIFAPITEAVDNAVAAAKKMVGEGTEAVKDAAKKAQDTGKQILESGKKGVGEAVDGVKKLFDKK